jgi:aminopeptidase N
MPETHCWSALAVLIAVVMPGITWAIEREQLPSGVTPLHYDLALVPDADNLRFSGRVQIAIAARTPTSSIVLNADELVLDKAVLDTRQAATAVTLDTKLQTATLTFDHPVASGSHTLVVDYHGTIGRATVGFFAMDYDSPAGKRRTIATNFEPASERRFMPSWDEPSLKATLSLTVDVPADRMAVANMPIASMETLASGQKRVHFGTTPKMSTYLYFLGIGDFERISTNVHGTEVGVVVNRGVEKKGAMRLAKRPGSWIITMTTSGSLTRFLSLI